VRIVAVNTGFIDIVFGGIDARNSFPLTGGIRQEGVAPQTNPTFPVDNQKLWLVRVLQGRSMTVFTWDNAMQILSPNFYNITMALCTIFVHFLLAGILVFERLIFPDFLVL
jgi:hypothetical protein